MIKKITEGITVGVETRYRDNLSAPKRSYFYFSYYINIKNDTAFTVQLLYRKWEIVDSNGEYREVEGSGVIGLQPIIEPGRSFSYESGCNFTTEVGKMSGIYIFQRTLDKSNIAVEIPEFIMEVPWLRN